MNREQWLENAVGLLVPLFTDNGLVVPKVRVSVGWPSAGGLSLRKRVIGQCWDGKCSADGTPQIFISPKIGDAASECGALPVLVHELVHAVVGCDAKHGAKFWRPAQVLGLTGKPTATVPNEELTAKLIRMEKELGPYPHVALDPATSGRKKQGTRMIKCECSACGYIARTSRKWIDEAGAPLCPSHSDEPMTYVIPPDLEGDE
jgi:hypothetical protein